MHGLLCSAQIAVHMVAALRMANCLVSQGCLPGVAQRRDMEAVKAERAHLLEQLAQVKLDPGKAGDDLQQEDIQFLRRELDIKKAKLNELHEVGYWAIPIVLGRTGLAPNAMRAASTAQGLPVAEQKQPPYAVIASGFSKL